MRHTALVFAFAVMLLGCAHGDESDFALSERTSILLEDGRFSGVVPTIMAREVFCGHQEAAVWAGVQGIVGILLLRADADCVVQEPLESEEELVRKFDWLAEGRLTFEGEAQMVDGPHGPIWTLPFKRDDRDCFFFKHDFGYESFSDVTASTHLIAGFFCGRPGTTNTDVEIRTFLGGITIVKPYRPRETRTVRSVGSSTHL